MKIVVTGGGTGGHIYPMATVATYLREKENADVLYIGNEDDFFPDKRLAKYFNLPFAGISSKGMEGGKPLQFLWKNGKGILQARKLLLKFKPDIVFSTGGFVSFPVVMAASSLGIPYVLHEQNTIMGKVNRIASKRATRILHTFPVHDSKRTVVTGNPVRFKTPLEKEGKYALFLGGSGGSVALNEAGVTFAKEHPHIPVMIQTGKTLLEKTELFATEIGAGDNLTLIPYKDDSYDLYKEAKCIVTRSGSGSIFEIANLSIPSILIPLPNSAEDHQKKNALFFTQENAAVMVEQGHKFQELLTEELLLLWESEEKRSDMREKLERLAVRDSEERIVNELLNIVNKTTKE